MNLEIPKEIAWSSEVQLFIKNIEQGKNPDFPNELEKSLFFKDAIARFLDHNDEKYRGDREGRDFLEKLKNYL